MKLSIDLCSSSELPSLGKIKQAFKYAEEMGLDEKKFGDIHVKFVGREHFHTEQKWIGFEASYNPAYIDDTPNDFCLLMIVLEVHKGKSFGRFRIWDPKKKENIAFSELLPYQEFLSTIKRAQDIGILHRDIRAQWHEFPGWKDILSKVMYVSNSSLISA